MLIKNSGLLLALILVLSMTNRAPLQAQNSGDNKMNGSLLLTFVPSSLITNSLRIDLDKRIHKNHWITLAPQYFLTIKSNYSDASNSDPSGRIENFSVSGYGIQAGHKVFLNKNLDLKGTYICYGIKFNQLQLDYETYTWVKYMDNNLEYYAWRLSSAGEDITSYGFNFMFGVQHSLLNDRVLIDLFAGMGLRLGNRTLSGITESHFSDHYWDYGKFGPHPLVGFRIGTKII